MDQLTADFIKAIEKVSFYNAGEGSQYWEEIAAAHKERQHLAALKQQMLTTHGVNYTRQVINATQNLCFMELTLPEETEETNNV